MNVQRSTLNNFCQLVKFLDRPERSDIYRQICVPHLC